MKDKLREKGYNRTSDNLISIYMKNKNFLNYNKNCTGKDLAMIMADYYDNLEAEMLNSTPNKFIMDIQNR